MVGWSVIMKKVKHKRSLNVLLYFDDLALFYLVRDTPPNLLARVFIRADARVSGAMIGVMTQEQREAIHYLMAKENDDNEKLFEKSEKAIFILADDLIRKGLVRRQGQYFFGNKLDEFGLPA